MSEHLRPLVGNDGGAAEGYYDTYKRSEHLEPERLLLLAILQDAIYCFRRYSSARDRAGRAQFRAAENWIMEQGNDWLFGFDNVCALLGLDPQYVRTGLLQWHALITSEKQLSKRLALRQRVFARRV